MAYQSFEELEVWKRSCSAATRIYQLLKDCKDYGLKDQMTRAAVSIASNISEGAERDSINEFIRFLHIAKGLLQNCEPRLTLLTRLGFLAQRLQRNLLKNLKLFRQCFML